MKSHCVSSVWFLIPCHWMFSGINKVTFIEQDFYSNMFLPRRLFQLISQNSVRDGGCRWDEKGCPILLSGSVLLLWRGAALHPTVQHSQADGRPDSPDHQVEITLGEACGQWLYDSVCAPAFIHIHLCISLPHRQPSHGHIFIRARIFRDKHIHVCGIATHSTCVFM